MIRRLSLSLLIGFAVLYVAHADDPRMPRKFTFQEPHMGTLFRIVLYAPDESAAKKAAAAAFARVAELNRIMSDYQADSELMQLCKKAGGPAVPVSPERFDILEKAEHFSRLTDGALDVTISPVVRLWRRARRTGQLPDPQTLKDALALVNYRNIRLDPQRRTVQLLVMGMLLDLGAIAKGYAADAALAVLRQHGIAHALVAAGGDIALGDPPPEAKGWTIGIAPLKNEGAAPTRHLLLANAGVSTAGDSEQFVEIAGTRYSHIVDPKSGLGLVGRRSVTVVAKNAATSDALDTALAVLGQERGQRLADDKGIAALFVFETPTGIETTMSKTFAPHGLPASADK